ncbi:class I adenylate-forming enzyme family protein [Gordonia rubripertincta]|uniref:Class I adenylate-forming enzyme family protein n=3 Tax=Gordonia rubripertincta TaxID=36822 RepID=A0AAW6R8G3_GORRU|nr:class I adenylate-forming enzyme family protein [Gordonia rubripertincta]MDG6780006.1 class I adenylate-forming enzyme family protein [Gordonia rubripertincta]NKY61193.1 acyl--CoA ligase [Gordonia rubripertincta]NKY61906.1 acyl--CoA ligase [Gordonia rubripertincta]GAB85081.1 putative long-chain-fatty-acid--CoA ligase [Gordonia rubripertincta NBRC 101908]
MSAPAMTAEGHLAGRRLTENQTSPLGRATIGDQLRRLSRSQGNKPAIIAYDPAGGRTSTSYADLNRMANRVAHVLVDLGVRRGDRVAVMSRNRVETVASYYGALKVGAAYSGVSPLFREKEIAQQLGHLEPAVLVVERDLAPLAGPIADSLGISVLVVGEPESDSWNSFDELVGQADDAEPGCDVDEHDLAMIVYTSGTESTPKGVEIAHRNYLISTAPAYTWGLRCLNDDVWLYVMPFHTIAGIGSLTSLTLLGATLVLPAAVDPATSLRMIRDEKISVLAQTPTFFIALANHPDFGPDTVGTVRRCLTYGGQVSPHAVDAWATATPESVWGTYWGQSELTQLGSVGWFKRLEDVPNQDPTWIGKPVGHLEVRVVDADGNEAEEGELLCRTPSVMLGYFKDPEKTAQVLEGGWVHTGDIVRIDDEGNMFFRDRRKDMIKTGGYNVASQEVERVLQSHPDVERAAVVGLPDPYWSEAVTGFVVLRAGTSASAEDIREYCRTDLASYKVPKAVHIVDELPTDAQGKLLKRELRRVHGTPQG